MRLISKFKTKYYRKDINNLFYEAAMRLSADGINMFMCPIIKEINLIGVSDKVLKEAGFNKANFNKFVKERYPDYVSHLTDGEHIAWFNLMVNKATRRKLTNIKKAFLLSLMR